ncbi:MAG: GGDEF domain-containing protein [Eggerthellaceae bacterium]
MLYNATTFILLFALVIFATLIHENNQLPRRNKSLFYTLTAVLAVVIISEWAGVQLSGNPIANGALLCAAKFADYTLTPTVAILIAANILSDRQLKLALIPIVLNVALQIVSLPFGLTFYLDGGFYYHHGPLYVLYLALVAVSLGIFVAALLSFGSKRAHKNRLSLILITFFVITGTLLQAIDSQMRVTNLTLILGTALLLVHYTEFLQQDTSSALVETSSENALRQRIITSFSESFIAALFIDLPTEKLVIVSATPKVRSCLNHKGPIPQQLRSLVTTLVSENYQEQMLHFMNFETLAQRMKAHSNISFEFTSKEGLWRRASFNIVDEDGNGQPDTLLLTFTDIQEEKLYAAELRAISVTDALTGLLNQRAYFQNLLALSESEVPDNLAIVIMDVNDLKHTNDTLGHEAGDLLLAGAGSCVKAAFESLGHSYRLGGDEFAAILQCTHEEYEQAAHQLKQRCAAFNKGPITHVSLAIGVAFFSDEPEMSLDQLSKRADLAMYEDKRRYYESLGRDRRRS